MKTNPFTIIFGMEPQSMIPRQEEYASVINVFESENPLTYGYVITGVRGCGKTVLMSTIQNYFEENEDWCVLRLNPDLDLYTSAISQLGEYIHLKGEELTEWNVSLAGFGAGIAKRSFADEETLFRKMVRQAKRAGKKILIAIDEASNTENIKTFAHSYQAFLGEKLPVYLLMTALPENFSALSNSKNGTFLRRLPKIRLGRLSDILVEQKYREIFKLSIEEASELSKTVRGYPYAFQLLGALLWDSGKKHIDLDILEHLDTMLYDGSYMAIWDHLTEKEKKIMCAIAHSQDGKVIDIRKKLDMESNQFSPYRENLKEYGLIDTKSYGEVHFCLPRFREFVYHVELYMS